MLRIEDRPPIAISDLEELACSMAGRLRIAAPRVALALQRLQTPARASIDYDPCGEIDIDSAFLDEFGRDPDACFLVLAHEVGHVYWDGRDDLETALPGPEWEDGADFTAGQLVAAFQRHPLAMQAALARVLAAYAGLDASGHHRAIGARQKVLVNGYAYWANERRFR